MAELKFGVENSANADKNRIVLENFLTGVQILPILDALDIYAKEKSRLRNLGKLVDDFDLLIGSSAIANNIKHFDRVYVRIPLLRNLMYTFV